MGVLSRIRPHVLNRFGAETVEIPSWLRSSLVGYWSGGHRDNVYYPLPMKNEVYYTPSTWAEWAPVTAQTEVRNSTGLSMTNETTAIMSTVIPTSVKVSTKYGILYNVVANSFGASFYNRLANALTDPIAIISIGFTGLLKAVITVGSSITTNALTIGSNANSTGELKINEVRVLELPIGSTIEADFTNLTADQLNAKHPFGNIETIFGSGNAPTKAEMDLIYAADGTAYWDGTRNVLCNPASKYYWADYSGNGRHGKLTNFAYATGSNLDQYGAYFDGVDDYISIADSAATRLTTGGTLFAWIKPKSIGENGNGRIFDKSIDAGGAGGYVFSLSATNAVRFRTQGGTPIISANNSIVLNTWQFVAVAFSSAGRQLYVNAEDVVDSGATITTLPVNVAGSLCIGNRVGFTDYTFDGSIGLAGICNRALTQAEIKYLFDSTRRRYGV